MTAPNKEGKKDRERQRKERKSEKSFLNSQQTGPCIHLPPPHRLLWNSKGWHEILNAKDWSVFLQQIGFEPLSGEESVGESGIQLLLLAQGVEKDGKNLFFFYPSIAKKNSHRYNIFVLFFLKFIYFLIYSLIYHGVNEIGCKGLLLSAYPTYPHYPNPTPKSRLATQERSWPGTARTCDLALNASPGIEGRQVA